MCLAHQKQNNMSEEIKTKTLRGAEFLIKEQDLSSVFIPEELNEEQEMIRQSVRDFVEKTVGDKAHQLEYQPELIE